MFKWKNIFKKDDKSKPKNKRWKNMLLWGIGIFGFTLSIFGLCANNSNNYVTVNNLVSNTKDQPISNIKSNNISSNDIKTKLTKISLNQSLLNFYLVNNEHDLIINYLYKSKHQYISSFNINYSYNSISLNNVNNQISQIIINSTYELNYFIKNIQHQKIALGATALVVSILICIIAWINLNLAIFIPIFLLANVAVSCAISSDVFAAFVETYNKLNENIYQNYIGNLGFFRPSNSKDVINAIKSILPSFDALKSQLQINSSVFGSKKIINYTNNNILDLQNLLSDLSSND